jgi:hypothetical protein
VLLTSKLWLDLVVGFLWGTLVSAINYGCLQWTIRRNAGQPPQKAAMAVLNVQVVRYIMDVAAMAAGYKHMWVLLGTAIGLTAMLKYTIITQHIERTKHPYVPKRSRQIGQKALRDSERPGGQILPGQANQGGRRK